MKIALIQMDVKFEKIEENFKNALNSMKKVLAVTPKNKPDVLVLPELFSTGFFPLGVEKFADKNGENLKEIFGKFAKENSVNIVAGSIITKKNGEIFNTCYVFDRSGAVVCEYDKMHCFSPMGEDEKFSSGSEVAKFELDGVVCSVAICYDLRFCELARSAAIMGIRVLFITAQWPSERLNHWVILNKARAIENQIFVCGVNGCGSAGEVKFGGNSLLIDPNGDEILHLSSQEDVKTAQIDPNFPKKFDTLKDRKAKFYKI